MVGLVITVALLVAACGDSGGDEGAADPQDVTTTAPDATTTTQPSGSDDGGSTDGGGSTDDGADGDAHRATATIDGVTYTFADTGFPGQQCLSDFFGVFIAALFMVDDQGNPNIEGGAISIAIPHEDTDRAEVDQWPEVSVNVNDPDLEWIADEKGAEEFEIEPGISQVDSYTVDGNTITGTASFYEQNSYWAVAGGQAEELVTATGTFEVTCGSDS